MATGRRFRGSFAAALCGLVAIAAHPAEGQREAERGVDLLAVEFMAVAADGTPIPDLRADEVTLRIGGRLRPIRTLQLISVADPPIRYGATPAAPLPPPFGTNAAADAGRTVVIVLDERSLRIGSERPLCDAVDRFLTSLSPRDRVAFVTMPLGGVKVNFTTEHDRVRTALSGSVGQAQAGETGSDMACRTRRILGSLVGLLGDLSAGEGPTTVLFFSTGLAAPRHDAPVMLAPGACELTVEEFEQVGVAAGAARAGFYVVQPEDPPLGQGGIQTENIAGLGFTGSDNPLAGLENLAGVTGAARLHLAAGPDVLERVTRETAAYYRAAFEPTASDRGSQSHLLDVRVSRAGAIVRSRPEITFPRARGSAPGTPREMLAVATVFRDLPLRATGYVSGPPADGRLKVVSIIEPIDPAATLTSAAVALVDAGGRVIVQWTAAGSDLARTPLLAAMMAPPGTYRLRAAAIDASGRKGTADEQVRVDLTPAGDLQLSSIVLGLSLDDGFSPRLQLTDEPAVVARLELYGGSPGAPVSTSLELAMGPNGEALASAPLTISATSDVGRYVATGALPIGDLPDGDFVVRATVQIEGQPAGRVVRTLRKVSR